MNNLKRILFFGVVMLFWSMSMQPVFAQCPIGPVTVSTTDVVCNGNNDGTLTISVNANGYAGNYEYSLVGIPASGALFILTHNTTDASYTFTGLRPATYIIAISPEVPCNNFNSLAIINEPPALTLTVDNVEANNVCVAPYDGSIAVTGAGGFGAITYSWTGPNGFTSSNEDITAIASGDYTVTATDQNNCTINQTINVPQVARSASFSYSGALFCKLDANPSPVLAPGALSGVFSSTAGLAIDPATGEIDLATSSTGNYTITNTLLAEGVCVQESATFNVQIVDNPDATIATQPAFCANDGVVVLTAASIGGVWSGPGITDPVTGSFDPSLANIGNNTITYTVTTGSCSAQDTEVILVNSIPDATIAATSPFCLNDAAVTLTAATSGGTWSGPGITAAGVFDPAAAGVGVHTITYTVTNANGCTGVDTEDVTVNPLPDATITTQPAFCANDAAVVLTAATAGGVWSGPGITDPATGAFDPTQAVVGNNTITYTVTTGGCSAQDSETIVVNAVPDATIAAQPAFCASDAAVVLTAATAGGVWSGPGITNPATGAFDPSLAAMGNNTITYTVTNANGCTSVDTEIIVINALPDATIATTAGFCLNDVAVTLTAATSGGIWSGPGISAAGVFDPAAAGVGVHTITYTVTNANGCTGVDTEDVTVNPLPDATITTQPAFCANDAAVVLTAATAGGVWSGPGITDPATGAFDPSMANIGNNTITYTVTNANGCAAVDTEIIIINALPDATIAAAGPYCLSDAAVTLTAATSGGTWSGPGITAAGVFDPAVANVGNHRITYTVASGSCVGVDSIEIDVFAEPTVNISSAGPFCESDGIQVLSATPAGGQWSGPGIVNTANGEFDPSVAGVGIHEIFYDITIGSCSDQGSFFVEVQSGPTLVVTDPSPVCSPGTIDITQPSVTAGSDPGTLSYWTDATATNPLANPTAISASGTYYIQLDNGTGCAPVQPVLVTITDLPVTSAISGNANPDCGEAGVVYSVTNTAGSVFNWSVPTDAVISAGQGTSSITVTFGNTNGAVSVTEENANGCVGAVVSSFISLQNCAFNIDFTADKTVVCVGEPVTFTDLSTGLSGSEDYDWSFGADATPVTSKLANPPAVTYATPGLKTVILEVTDGANSSIVTKSDYIEVVSQPTAVLAGNESSCAGVPVSLSVTASGTGPWNITYTDGTNNYNASFNTSPFSLTVAPLTSTTYSLVSVDDANCSGAVSGTGIVNIAPQAVVTLSVDDVDATPGGTALVPVRVSDFVDFASMQFTLRWNPTSLAFAGIENISLPLANFGTANVNAGSLTFQWSSDAMADTSMVDDQIIFAIRFTAGSAGCTDEAVTIAQAPPVPLALQVMDQAGCRANPTIINGSVQTLPAPPVPVANPVAICVNTPVPALSVTPNTAAGTVVSWYSDRAGNNMVSTGNSFTPVLNTAIAIDTTFYFSQNVPACGVSAIDSIVLRITAGPAGTSLASSDADNSICFGESVTFTASPGGQPRYQFFLNGASVQDGAGNQFVKADLADQDSLSLRVYDAAGCFAEATGLVTSVRQLVINYTATDITSCGAADGVITISSVTGASGTVQYNWQGPSITDPSLKDQSGLDVGTYTLTATDNGSGCSEQITVILSDPVSFTTAVNQSNVTTFGGADGSINLTVTGGTGPFTIAWTGPNGYTNSGANISNLSAGSYTATIEDMADGCTAIVNVNITEPAPGGGGLILDATKTDVTTCGAADGTINLTVQGSSGSYSVAWFGPNGFTASTQNLSGLPGGLYVATVRDLITGITAQWTVEILEPASFSINLAETGTSTCTGVDGSVQTTIVGGSGNFTYSWIGLFANAGFSASTRNLANLAPGFYRLRVQDNVSGCRDSAVVEIQLPASCGDPCSFNVSVSTDNVACPGDKDGEITLIVISGGSGFGNYFYKEDTSVLYRPFKGDFATNFKGRPQGRYSFVVKDTVTGCQDNAMASIGVGTNVIAIVDVDNAGCDGNDGIISFNISGGVAPISVTLTDADGFQVVQTGNGFFQFENLSEGKFVYEVVEASGCTILSPDSLAVAVDCGGNVCTDLIASAHSFEDATCATNPNGRAIVDVTGGASPYEYTVDGISWIPFISGNKIDRLPPNGTYNITVRQDSVATCRVDVAVSIDGPPAIVLDDPIVTVQEASCNLSDGSVQVGAISGGTGGYDYQLDGDFITMPADRILAGLKASIHTLSAIDDAGCRADFDFSVRSPGAIIASVSEVPVRCTSIFLKAGIEVNIDLDATDISGPYEMVITPENRPDEDSVYQIPDAGRRTVLRLDKGYYEVTVRSTTEPGCAFNETVALLEGAWPVDFDIIARDSVVSCLGGQGSVTIGNFIGDLDTTFVVHLYPAESSIPIFTGEYNYFEIENGLTIDGDDFRNNEFKAGIYYIRVFQDQDGCNDVEAISAPFIIYEPEGVLGFEVLEDGVSLPDQPTGYILGQVIPSGGSPYEVLIQLEDPLFELSVAEIIAFNESREWVQASRSGNNQNLFLVDLQDLPAGTYTIYVRDVYGCEIAIDYEIGYDNTVFIPNVFTPNDDGFNDAFYIRNLPESGTQIVITNRTGVSVFKTDNYTTDNLWDGGDEADGIYFYSVKMPNGDTYKGWVELWREVRP